MRKTGALTVAAIVIVGAAAGWLFELWLVASGHASATPPLSYAALVAVLGVLIAVFAIPVRNAARGKKDRLGMPARVDPFYATRVLALGKSASIVGALLTGGTGAITVFVLFRPSHPSGLILPSVLGFGGSLVLLVGGLLAEEMCRIPPADSDPDPDDDGPMPIVGSH